MFYKETKVYCDGSHYVAIPHTTRPKRKSVPKPEEEFTVLSTKETRKVTRKQLFEESYQEAQSLPKNERKKFVQNKMESVLSAEEVKAYVEENVKRKRNNLISRRIRMTRKANLQEFNYFCTFTYDDKKHTEESFRKKLTQTFWNMSKRKGWKYIGVWERSPEKQRLHFHGIFYIPDDTFFPGELVERRDYSFAERKRKATMGNTYFKEKFGRNDFEKIEDKAKIYDVLSYLMKYLSESGERIVYSRGLPQFFISDVTDEDVVCKIGQEEKKLLLFDNFTCWDEGEYIGEVSPEVIKRLRKGN